MRPKAVNAKIKTPPMEPATTAHVFDLPPVLLSPPVLGEEGFMIGAPLINFAINAVPSTQSRLFTAAVLPTDFPH